MTEEVSELLKKALALPPEARAALAGSLLESLDETVDASAEEAWSQEIARRIEELDSGKVKPIPWAEAHILCRKVVGRQVQQFLAVRRVPDLDCLVLVFVVCPDPRHESSVRA